MLVFFLEGESSGGAGREVSRRPLVQTPYLWGSGTGRWYTRGPVRFQARQRASPPSPLLRPPVAGTNDLYVVSGQHAFSTAAAIREECLAQNLEPPAYCLRHRVQLLRDGLKVPMVLRIAGLLQGGSQSVKPLTMAETMHAMLRVEEAMKDELPGDPTSHAFRTALLRETYDTAGKSTVTDGTVVCTLLARARVCMGSGQCQWWCGLLGGAPCLALGHMWPPGARTQ